MSAFERNPKSCNHYSQNEAIRFETPSRYHLVNKINQLRENPLPPATLITLTHIDAANPPVAPCRQMRLDNSALLGSHC